MPPISLEEAERRRQQVTLDVQSIQAQLGDKQRTDDKGRRLSNKEYWAWKKKAQHALNKKLDELRLLKAYIRDNRKDKPSSNNDLLGHLRSLYFLATSIQKRVELSAAESKQIDAAKHLLDRIDNTEEKTNEDNNRPAANRLDPPHDGEEAG